MSSRLRTACLRRGSVFQTVRGKRRFDAPFELAPVMPPVSRLLVATDKFWQACRSQQGGSAGTIVLATANDSGGHLKLLLTSGGVTNASIREALVDLLGKPIEESNALCIPTAQWGHPMCGPSSVRGFVCGTPPWGGMTSLEWKSLGVLELTALSSIGEERWLPWVREADALLADGGDTTYLCHWMRQCGLADLLPSLSEMVWVGVSAGSMVMTPRIGDDFVRWPSATDDRTLGIVDFSIFPHLDNPDLPSNTMDTAEAWAAGLSCPAYVIDDQTAIKASDGVIEVVSEGHWKLLAPNG